jgi:tRNA dimethylallyltransferase
MSEEAAICIMGPTGTGKTELALQVAARFDVEIISVDSAMVYRHMDVGTAKPDAAARAAVPHHLIDARDPWEAYSAGDFRADALRLMAEIRGRGRVPLLVGGTMLYFRALERGLAELPGADPGVRAALDAEAARFGWPALHARLATVDPAAAARIKPGDRQRIQRALEVYTLAGEPISELQSRPAGPRVTLRRVALVPSDRAALYARLDRRFRAMVAGGFVEEVGRLMRLPLMSPDRPSMRAVGYRQIWAHLAGETSREEALRQAEVATHRLAKRQMTWLRPETAELGLDPQEAGCAERAIEALAAWGCRARAGDAISWAGR